MGEVLTVAALLVLAGGVVALRAVLDGRLAGVPASLAVLAPVAETARLLRSRPVGGGGSALPVAASGGLLAAAALRVLALPVVGGAVLDRPLGVAWLLVADAVWWAAGALLRRDGLRRYLLRAAAVEAPLLLALAVPVVAARSASSGEVLAAQAGLPFAAEAPVALLVLLVVGGVLLPWAVAPRASGAAPLIGAGLAAQPVATAAVAAVLLLGAAGALPVAALTAALSVLLVLAARRFPVLPPALVARLSLRALLPIAAVQLAVVAVLALLGGT